MCKGIVRNSKLKCHNSPARCHPHNWTMGQTIRNEWGRSRKGGREGAMQFWVIFHCHLYWDAAPVLSNRVILYMAFLLDISNGGGEGGGRVMGLLPFFFSFFLRVKACNVSSRLVIITDQLLIKIKWSFLNFNTVLQIMQKTQLIALLAKITFKNSSTQRTKII